MIAKRIISDIQRSLHGKFDPKQNPRSFFSGAFDAFPTSSGPITQKAALTIPTYWRCVTILSQSVSLMPFNVVKKESGVREIQKDHPAQKLLTISPNNMMNPYDFLVSMFANRTTVGNGFAAIQRNGNGTPLSLIPIIPDNVTPFTFENSLWYQIRLDDGQGVILMRSEDVLHFKGFSFDGIWGLSNLRFNSLTHGISIEGKRTNAELLENGSQLEGIVSVQGTLSEKDADRMHKSWAKRYTGRGKRRTALLDSNAKYQAIALSPQETQLLEMLNANGIDITRGMGVPPHLVYYLDRATDNNIEKQGTEFVQYTLDPMATQAEQEIRTKLFAPSEQSTLQAEWSFNGLLRGDARSRAELNDSLVRNGIISPNMAAIDEGRDTHPGGDKYYVPAQLINSNIADQHFQSGIDKRDAQTEAIKKGTIKAK